MKEPRATLVLGASFKTNKFKIKMKSETRGGTLKQPLFLRRRAKHKAKEAGAAPAPRRVAELLPAMIPAGLVGWARATRLAAGLVCGWGQWLPWLDSRLLFFKFQSFAQPQLAVVA
jgi:hypothetical protein